jgi:hypothetical protein
MVVATILFSARSARSCACAVVVVTGLFLFLREARLQRQLAAR